MSVKGLAVATALSAILVAGRAAHGGVVVSDFDPGGTYYGGTEGWFAYGAPGMDTATPTGSTSGAYMRVDVNQYGSHTVTAQNWAVPDVTVGTFIAQGQLEIDVLLSSSGANAWYPSNAAATLGFELQLFGGTTGSVSHTGTVGYNGSVKDAPVHLIWDYNDAALDPTATGWNLTLKPDGPGYAWEWDAANPAVVPFDARFHVDNVQLTQVPEPTSLAVVAIAGGAALLRRRRCRRQDWHQD